MPRPSTAMPSTSADRTAEETSPCSGQPSCRRGWRLAAAVGSDARANSSHLNTTCYQFGRKFRVTEGPHQELTDIRVRIAVIGVGLWCSRLAGGSRVIELVLWTAGRAGEPGGVWRCFLGGCPAVLEREPDLVLDPEPVEELCEGVRADFEIDLAAVCGHGLRWRGPVAGQVKADRLGRCDDGLVASGVEIEQPVPAPLLIRKQVDQVAAVGGGGGPEIAEVEIAGGRGPDPALQVAALCEQPQ